MTTSGQQQHSGQSGSLHSPKTPTKAFAGTASAVSSKDVRSAFAHCAEHFSEGRGVPLYLHIPFCSVRCCHCTRVSAISSDSAEIDRYLTRLSQELQQAAAQIDAPLLASRVYIGGGTPNLLSQNQLIQLTDIIEQSCVIQEQAERIIEVNPYKATYAQLALLRGLGYTQIQIELHELLGLSQRGVERSCSFQLLADVFANAREVGFTKIGIDISYGNRACNKEDFASALDDLLTLCPDRVVCHAAPAVNGIDSACDPVMSHGQKLALFVEMLQCFERFGYEWVGVSAFTRPDDEWVAAQREGRLYRNWLGYTTTRDEAVLGFGLGAVSELPGLIVQNHQDLRSWSDAIESGKPPVEKGIIVSALAEQERELLGYLSSTAQTATVGDTELEMVTSLVSKGIVVASDGHIRLTAFGRAFLNQSNDWDEALSSEIA